MSNNKKSAITIEQQALYGYAIVEWLTKGWSVAAHTHPKTRKNW